MTNQADQHGHLTQSRLRSPRAAGIAGILFSVLMIPSMVLVYLLIPEEPTASNFFLQKSQADAFALAVSLVPIAGVAFLWFMGVARDLLGHLEDQFFSTVFTGSGLLFLGMIFVWAALGATILAGYGGNPEYFFESELYGFGRTFMQKLFGIHAMGMAGVYVFSSGSIWFKTKAMPRWMVLLTWGVAIFLWLASFLPWWVQLSFPVWVLFVSVYILNVNLRNQGAT
jgi:hypothetical protein